MLVYKYILVLIFNVQIAYQFHLYHLYIDLAEDIIDTRFYYKLPKLNCTPLQFQLEFNKIQYVPF
jgi:hypothetical protein